MSLFKCSTTHTTVFKYMFDMLFHNMSTVPITISDTGFQIYTKTDSGYTFLVEYPKASFDEWSYTGSDPLYFGLGTLNSQDFKELTSKSVMEMSIDKKQSSLDAIVLKIKVTNSSRKFIKQFIMYSEEIPFIPSSPVVKGAVEIRLTAQDFTSLCKGFKSGMIRLTCFDDEFSIASKLAGVREKQFLFPLESDPERAPIDATFSADRLLSVLKVAMCAGKGLVLYIAPEGVVINTLTNLGSINIHFAF